MASKQVFGAWNVEGGSDSKGDQPDAIRGRWWNRRWVKAAGFASIAVCLLLVLAAEYILHNAEPIVRKRIIETLSARFDAPVELDRVDISLFRGIEVDGYGLRIPFGAGKPSGVPGYPMIGVQHFAFRTTFEGLLRQPTHLAAVRVEGMELHILRPPSAG